MAAGYKLWHPNARLPLHMGSTYTCSNLCAIAVLDPGSRHPDFRIPESLFPTYLLTVQGLSILHDFIQDAQYYLRGHLAFQLCAFQLQVGVEL